MNPARQFDVHPDAEILSGFVENALPDTERGQVLAHLGGCGRCRQIVYLAQDAMTAAEAPARAPMAERRVVEVERAWFLRGRIPWATAFAFAAVVAFAVFLTIRRGTSTQQMAKLAPSQAPTLPAAASPAVPVGPAQSEKAKSELQAIAPEIATPTARTRARSSAAAASTTPVSVAPTPPPAPALPAEAGAAQQATDEANSPAPSAPPDLNGSMSPPKPASSAAMRAMRFQSAPQAMPGVGSAAKTEASGSSAGAAPSAAETVEVNADSIKLQPQAAAPAEVEMQPSPVAAGAAPAKKSGLILLPSGLPLVSTAEAGHTQLAIDVVGSLFLSRDMGKSWEPVERQWTGRLTKVRMAQVLKARNSLPSAQMENRPAQATAPVSLPAALFEIVNDKNAVWTSADGKAWRAK